MPLEAAADVARIAGDPRAGLQHDLDCAGAVAIASRCIRHRPVVSRGVRAGWLGSNARPNVAGANVTTSTRFGRLTISDHPFSITQTGCTFAINPTGTVVSGSRLASGAVQIITADGCNWTVTGLPPWASTASGDSGARSYRLAVIETTLWVNWFFIGSDYSSFYAAAQHDGVGDQRSHYVARRDGRRRRQSERGRARERVGRRQRAHRRGRRDQRIGRSRA